MIVEGLFLGPLIDGEQERLHFFITFAVGEGLVGIAVAGPVFGDNPTDDTPILFVDDLVFGDSLSLFKKEAHLDVKKTGDF